MSSRLLPALALATALATPALAQQQPQQVAGGGAQALQDARQDLQTAADRLRQASGAGDEQAVDRTKAEVRRAIDEVRRAMGRLTPEQRADVQERLRQAEQGLQVGGPEAGARAADGLADAVAAVSAPAKVIGLGDWSYDELYADGWRAETLIDATVHGPTGEEIGEVENVIVGPDGKILSIIAEVGGIWDIGDTHVNVPWNEVEVASGREGVTIPVTQDTVERYSLFPDTVITAKEARTQTEAVDDDLMTGPRAWKLSELVNDYVRLRDVPGYGYVDDVVFDKEGALKAVVVRPDVIYRLPGHYAYPYEGYAGGWDPTLDAYQLPYDRAETEGLERFDYGKMERKTVAAD
jgi:sporulation protein YlmC with PRC-barrel domain